MSPAEHPSTQSDRTATQSAPPDSPSSRSTPPDSFSSRSTPPDPSSSRSTPPDRHPSRSSRRAFLATAGTAAATSLAGCSALTSGDDVPPLTDEDWHSYGNGPTNDNRVAGGVPPLTEHEILTSADWTYAPPVVHDGVAYVAADRRVVAAAADGTERWSSDLDVEVAGAPALDPDRGRLYVPTRVVGTTDGPETPPASVTALTLADGDVIGAPTVGDEDAYGLTVADGDVYVRSATACVRLAPDGTERWRRSLPPLVYDEYRLGDSTATQITPAVTGGGVYVPDRNALVKLDRETGDERWRVPVDTPYAAPVVDERGVVQTGWQETVAVDRSGEVRWRRDLHSRAAAALDGTDVYVVAGDLHEVDAASGETNWRAHLPGEGTEAPVVTEDHVLAVSGDVRAFRRDVGGLLPPERLQWTYSEVHAATYSSPVVAAGRVFVVGPMGLLALRPAAGD
ncbi:MAG: PQQ-binding-like beta-propeller repeat protein [Haloferacaceae archaeon]